MRAVREEKPFGEKQSRESIEMNNRTENKNIKVLMYHRISEEQPSDDDCHVVHVEDFRRQLMILENLNYIPITFEDYYLYLEGKLTLPKKPIIITFDDGHLDTYNLAYPLLREFDMRAVVFVIGQRSWEYARWEENAGEIDYPLMSNEQILELHREGFEIGAHSMTHAKLPELSQGALSREVFGSKKEVENLLGEDIISFAYPYGGVSEGVQFMTRKAGFKFGCGVYTGPPRFGEDKFNIRRLAITSKIDTFQFLLRLVTPYEYAEWLYNKVKRKFFRLRQVKPDETPLVDYEKTLRR